MMQVLILATGENKKLTPLCDATVPCMLPVANRPIMEYAVEQLARQGYKHMLVSLFSQAYQVEAYFDSGQRWGVTLDYHLQRDALETAGAIKWAGYALKETFLFLPADILIEMDFAHLLQQHRDSASTATVVLHSPRHVEGFTHTTTGEPAELASQLPLIETGVYLFEHEVLDFIPARIPYDISTQLIPALKAAGKKVTSYVCSSHINFLESFSAYQTAQMDVVKSSTPTKPIRVRQISNGIWIGRNTHIHPGARLAAPVLIGSNTRIDEGVELGPDVVIGSNVVIRSHTHIQQSTILDNTYIGQMLHVIGRVVQRDLIIDNHSGEYIHLPDPLLAGPAFTSELGGAARRIFDVGTAITLFMLTLPLTLLITIFTWWETGKVVRQVPALRKGSGMGEDRPIQLRQFVVENNASQLTTTGRWLMAFELHRLPELWNVINGDMHMVGVKPLPIEAAPMLTEEWQRKRNECLPGFTGLWFIQSNQNESLDEILVTDAYYTATNNWRMDLNLLLKTPFAWFQHIRSKEFFRTKLRSKKQWN